jgi:hypothetical protein
LSLDVAALGHIDTLRRATASTQQSQLTAVVADQALARSFELNRTWEALAMDLQRDPAKRLVVFATTPELKESIEAKLESLRIAPNQRSILLQDSWARADADGVEKLVPDVLRRLLAATAGQSQTGAMRFYLSKPPQLDLTGMPAFVAQIIFLLDDLNVAVTSLDTLIETAEKTREYA